MNASSIEKLLPALGLFLIGAALGTSAPAFAGEGRPAAGKPIPPVPVVVAEALRKSVPVRLATLGNVEAIAHIEIRSQVGGQLVGVHVRDGQAVRKGEPIFTIDPRPFEAGLKQARGTLARDTAAAANSEIEVRRAERLFKDGALTQEQLEAARAASDAAKGTVQADQAAVDNAALQLEWASIRAPIDGRAGAVTFREGSQIKAVDTGPLVVINQLRPIYVTFSVPEARLPDLRRQMAAAALAVTADVPGDGPAPEEGQLTFVDNAVDQTTGMIRLKATFPNAAERLWPGQYVNVGLLLRTIPDAITVPNRALQTGQGGRYVWVIRKDQTAEMRPVTAGLVVDQETVIEKGLAPGEQVVVDGQLRLAPDAPVQVGPGLGTAPAGK